MNLIWVWCNISKFNQLCTENLFKVVYKIALKPNKAELFEGIFNGGFLWGSKYKRQGST